MRLGVRVVLCLLALSLAAGSGCRKPLTPNIDRNEAPETWITAAPMDTLTIRDHSGQSVPGTPSITTIPVRFHLYWAASDKDGAIAGFYWAVVETTATPLEGGGGLASLPGPKPQDYHFTTKTDSTFIFDVSEVFPDRQHTFYIYAVDNQGKADPTPARFIFNAIDKFPPRPVIDMARASGQIVRLTLDGTPIPFDTTYFITDTLNPRTTPTDTVPAGSRLDFHWHGMITLPGTYVTLYRYKLDEPQFQTADSSVHSVSYGTGLAGSAAVTPGQKIFTLRALDQANGAGETTRRFIVNFSPDTWWAGPDPSLYTSSDGEYNSHSLEVFSWPSRQDPTFNTSPPLPPGTFGPDSFQYRPSRRLPPNRDFSRPGTFYEIYKNRLYARTEGDTVHMNSWVILWNGGYDKDSRYQVRADSTDPYVRNLDGSFVTGELLQNAGMVGSPIGFRSIISSRLTPSGLKSSPAQTSIYPVYEPASVFRAPRVGGYWRMFQAGKAYALARAEDADGGIDNTIDDPATLADRVDQGGGTPTERALRRKVLVFYVDKAPALIRDLSFQPREGDNINTIQWNFVLRGMDLDPFDPSVVGPAAGGPTASTITRFKVTLYGKNLAGRDTAWTYLESNGLPYINRGTQVTLNFVPGGSMANNPFASGPITVSIQICDCIDCETTPGQGRCVNGIDPVTGQVADPQNVIHVNYTRPPDSADLGTMLPTGGRPGPDPSGGRH